MPRGTLFSQVIDDFREQAGQASSRALNQNQLNADKALLRRVYRRLHMDFEWPHLFIERDEQVLAGERYYTLPAELPLEAVREVRVRENGTDLWYPLTYGIGIHKLNAVHSDSDEREDFPISWEIHENGQYEIWPIPETSGHTLRFFGRAVPKRLTSESDTLDLDDDLVILYALAERLRRDKSPEADDVLTQARRHYMRLRGLSSKSGPVSLKVSGDRGPQYAPIDIKYAEWRD